MALLVSPSLPAPPTEAILMNGEQKQQAALLCPSQSLKNTAVYRRREREISHGVLNWATKGRREKVQKMRERWTKIKIILSHEDAFHKMEDE